jgi:hypothetical protein
VQEQMKSMAGAGRLSAATVAATSAAIKASFLNMRLLPFLAPVEARRSEASALGLPD